MKAFSLAPSEMLLMSGEQLPTTKTVHRKVFSGRSPGRKLSGVKTSMFSMSVNLTQIGFEFNDALI
jgi:hypothetical protein